MKTNQITIQVPEGTSVVKELDKDGFTVEQCNNSYGLFEGTIKVSW